MTIDQTKVLKAAFKKKELNQSLLASLEKLRMDGSITVRQYEVMKHRYQQNMTASVSEIAAVTVLATNPSSRPEAPISLNFLRVQYSLATS